MAAVTSAQVAATLDAARALGDAVRDLGSVPEGVLYANLCGALSLRSFQVLVDALIRAGVVARRPGPILVWIGPPKGGV